MEKRVGKRKGEQGKRNERVDKGWAEIENGKERREREIKGNEITSVIMPLPYGRGHKAMLRFVCPSIRLSYFPILSRSLDGDMRASTFQTHSIGGSTVSYARIKMNAISMGDIASLRDIC